MKDAVLFGRRVTGTASSADKSRISLVQQAPQLDLLVPLYAPNSDRLLRLRAAKMTVWVIDEKARTTDDGAAITSDRTAADWLADLNTIAGPHFSGYTFGGGSNSSGGSESSSDGSSMRQDEDLVSVENMYDRVGDGCQQLSAVSHDNKGNVIIGLSGMGKLGLLMDPANKMVFSVRRERTLGLGLRVDY